MSRSKLNGSPRGYAADRRGTQIARATLTVLALVLIVLAIRSRNTSLIDGPLWDLQQSSHLKSVILNLCMASLAEFLAYALVGFLAIQCFPGHRSKSAMAASPLLTAMIIGIGLSAVVSTAGSGPGLRWPIFIDMLLPSVGTLIGAWIGVSWAAGEAARRWIVAKLAFLGGCNSVVPSTRFSGTVSSREPNDVQQ